MFHFCPVLFVSQAQKVFSSLFINSRSDSMQTYLTSCRELLFSLLLIFICSWNINICQLFAFKTKAVDVKIKEKRLELIRKVQDWNDGIPLKSVGKHHLRRGTKCCVINFKWRHSLVELFTEQFGMEFSFLRFHSAFVSAVVLIIPFPPCLFSLQWC